jgi:heme exporter protein A
MSRAPLWILDEPFTALDHAGRNMMERQFAQHCEKGGMIIFTTHHPVSIDNTHVQELQIGEISS